MKYTLLPLFLSVYLPFMPSQLYALETAATTATVARVLDGDTFTTTKGEAVRLLGINTPETGSGKRAAEPWGQEASAVGHQLLDGQTVRLVTQKKERDRYGRVLADVYLADGTWVNAALLKAGAAHVYTFPDNTYNAEGLFAAETEARSAKRGLWSLPRWHIRAAESCCSQKEIGEFQLVEGIVRDIVKIKGRIYMNFGTDWRTDFTAEIKEPDWHRFNDIESLRGKNVRVRGYLKPVNGALVTVTHPEQIERMP